MKTPAPIRLGIIGTGLAVKKLHWPALIHMRNRFVITAFANRTRATAEAFAAEAGLAMDGYCADYRDLLAKNGVDAVLISVPIPQLLPIARDALAAGKHVLCEKPPGVDLNEARQFVASLERHPYQKFMMTENFIYRDDLRLARSLLDDGAIGRPQLLFERWVDQLIPRPGEYSETPWRYQPAYRGGPLQDGGVHSIATIRFLGGDIGRLFARVEWLNTTMQAPSAMAMTCAFANGMTGTCLWGFLGNPVHDEPRETRVYGSEGALLYTRGRIRHVRASGAVDDYRVEPIESGHYNMFLNFYEALVHDTPIAATLEQSIANMLVVWQALQSADTGSDVTVSAPGLPLSPGGVPLWTPRNATGLFDGLPSKVRRA